MSKNKRSLENSNDKTKALLGFYLSY